jgi:hypothetical protein
MNNLYPRISSRTARAGHAAGKESSVIGFKGTQAGVDDCTLGSGRLIPFSVLLSGVQSLRSWFCNNSCYENKKLLVCYADFLLKEGTYQTFIN